VRLYYSNRIFMGFCCVCCEVLYLALFLLHLPAYQTWGLLDVQVRRQDCGRSCDRLQAKPRSGQSCQAGWLAG
jgi:hypothetical protein